MMQYRVSILLMCVCALLLNCSHPTQMTGATDMPNEISAVSGVVVSSDNKPVAGVSVMLRRSDYLADSVTSPTPTVITIETDSVGRFTIDSVDTGNYTIEANDNKSDAGYIHCAVDGMTDVVDGGSLTLLPYARVHGKVSTPDSVSAAAFVQIYGLERLVPVDSNGLFVIDDLPQGDFVLRVLPRTIQFRAQSIPVQPKAGEQYDIGTVQVQTFSSENYAQWHSSRTITINTSATGANISGSAPIINFPLLIWLNASNFPFDSAAIDGRDIRFANSNGIHLPYEIERWNSANDSAEIWVKVDTIWPANDSQYITLSFGKNGVESWTDGSAVFDSADGFVGVWHFGAGDPMADASPNRNQAIDSGTALVAGGIGSARYFSGRTFVSVTDNATLEPDNFTISAWVRRSGVQDSLCKIVQKGTPYEPFGSYSLEFRNQTDMVGFQIAKSDSTYPLITSKHEVSDGVWCLLTGTYDGATGTSELYVNGQSRGTFTHPVSINYYTDIDYPLIFGAQIQNGANFRGSIDEVRLSRVVRSGDWTRLCYENQKQGMSRLLQWR